MGGARSTLEAFGVRFVAARRVGNADDAALAATDLAYPVVLKNVEFAHKSDEGAVLLNIADEVQLRRSVELLPRPALRLICRSSRRPPCHRE